MTFEELIVTPELHEAATAYQASWRAGTKLKSEQYWADNPTRDALLTLIHESVPDVDKGVVLTFIDSLEVTA